ncbi:Hint domain-containing protein [Acidiphilium sp. PA]|uniref:Hint domain-containing protein n=1 Tax=Acidiphilium sp. PA TaxID=2871705 RepID=UPI002242CE50|nr:Hint domain-containing protein [Acidiphilium sp. PA]MCW8306620.1 Hint domain-containing protein [Acidiphilium sp. PA]
MTATNLNDSLGTLSADQQAIVSFESNANPNLTPANPSFNTYLLGSAEIQTPEATLQAGATITYAFSPGSYTAAQQADIEQAMAAWSGVCNVTWVYQPNYAANPATGLSTTAALSLINMNNNPGGEYDQTIRSVPAGQPGVYQSTQEEIVTDLGGSYGTLGDYATGGYGQGAILHELGHVLGLGHTGAYNGGGADAAQTNAYDTRAWSVMSYVDPNDPAAKYYAQSATPGADYNGNTGTGPMGLDIYAVQRLYGAPTSTMFAGGQIFGFNSNITYTTPAGTRAAVEMYNFAVNTNPVITLYDYGTGNTLDLSGYSSNDRVNLNPGSFSSVNGYVDNIFIEYGTAIDRFIAGSGNDVIFVNSQADTIIGGSGNDIVTFADPFADYSFSRSGGSLDVSGLGVTDTLSGVTTLQFSDRSVLAATLACFAAATRIATEAGPVAVEQLAIGDRVVLATGGSLPIVWIGHRVVDLAHHPAPDLVQPIRIEPGALADGIPARPLLVSPDHALFCAGHLIPAKALINGTTIRQIERASITYYHVELPRHAVLLAEAAPAESYLDTGNRTGFSNASGPVALHPAFAQQRREQSGCAPFAEAGPVVEAVRTGILARACIVTTADPGLAIRHTGGAAIIASRSAIPGHLTPDPRDRRRLGVKIASLSAGGTPIPLDHPALRHGWHDPEPDGRWTDGDALVPAELLAGARLEVGLAATVQYPVERGGERMKGRASFL